MSERDEGFEEWLDDAEMEEFYMGMLFDAEVKYQQKLVISYPVDEIQRAAIEFCKQHGVNV